MLQAMNVSRTVDRISFKCTDHQKAQTSARSCLPSTSKGATRLGLRNSSEFESARYLSHCRSSSVAERGQELRVHAYTEAADHVDSKPEPKNLKVLIAGGGIGGLTTAHALRLKGYDVQVFEKTQRYRPFGGPIQLQCNSIGTLQAIDQELGDEVIENSTITGDRINGLMDGVHGGWYFRFDTRKPCHANGLPLTLVIQRSRLQELLVERVGDCITSGTEVVSYTETEEGVTCTLSNGEVATGDILIGADGIRSKIRSQMRGEPEDIPLSYSGYTVYTGISQMKLELTDVEKIGYQVFLGPDNYFVASDVGDNQQQWYAFHREKPAGVDTMDKRDQLFEYYDGWQDNLVERLSNTPAEAVERRDVYDIKPAVLVGDWTQGRVALLGDAVHAVQPNLGQGGGQAIESAYTLADELDKLVSNASKADIEARLRGYTLRRVLRCGAIHGLSRMAALMNIVYRPYLGSNPYSIYPEPVKAFWLQVEKLRIPHPGRVVGQVMMMGSMQYILEYVGSGFGLPQVTGGTPAALANKRGERIVCCQVPGVSTVPKRPLKDEDFKMKGLPGFGQ